MKKLLILIVVLLCIFTFISCSYKGDEVVNPFTFENLRITVTDLHNQEPGNVKIVYSINDFNRFKVELDLKVVISVVDQNENKIDVMEGEKILIVAGNEYFVTITAETKSGNKTATYTITTIDASGDNSEDTVSDIRLKRGSLKTEYSIGEILAIDDAMLQLIHKSGKITEIPLLKEWVTNFDTTSVGNYFMGINYQQMSKSVPYTVKNEFQSSSLTYKLINNYEEFAIIGGNLDNIDKITIPTTLNTKPITTISNGAFSNNSDIKTLAFANGTNVRVIEEYAFSNCKNLSEVFIPSALQQIQAYAFNGCSSLNKFEFGVSSEVDEIAANTFNGCSSLTKIILPNAITTINTKAFANCENLRTVLFEENKLLGSIKEDAFLNTPLLEVFYIQASQPPILEGNVFGEEINLYILVSDDDVDLYKKHNHWSRYSSNIRSSTINIDFKVNKAIKYTRSVEYGKGIADIPEIPEITGYNSKWSQQNFSSIVTISDENLVVTAIYMPSEIKIIFRVEGCEDIVRTIEYRGTLTDFPEVPQKVGYNSTWSRVDFLDVEELECIVESVYTPKNYTITFDVDNGNDIPPLTVAFGTTFQLLDATKLGHNFQGWYISNAYNTLYNERIMPNENVIVYARFLLNNYTMTFVTNGGNIIQPVSEQYDTPIKKVPAKQGYAFLGWYDNVELAGESIEKVLPYDVTLYAKWQRMSYEISFSTNGGEQVESLSYDYDEDISTIELPESYRKGYDFISWCEDWFTEIEFSLDTMPPKNLILYAKWEKLNFNITFVTNGEEIATHNYSYDDYVAFRPIVQGYSIEGYYKDADFEIEYQINKMPAENLTLHIKLAPITYSIYYILDGGINNINNPLYYDKESLAINEIILADPTKKGYTFEYWHTKIDEGNVPLTKIEKTDAGNKTIYAKWSINESTLTFIMNVGDEVLEQTDVFNTPLNIQPQRTGYKFVGWYLDANFETKFEGNRMPAQDETLYAKWTAKVYTITYTNGYNHSNPLSYTIEDDNILLSPAIKQGYTFLKWVRDGVEVTEIIINKENPSDILVTAWSTINEYTLTFETNGGSLLGRRTIKYDLIIPIQQRITTREYYSFVGWYNEDFSIEYDLTRMPSENLTVYAKWKAIDYRIFYNIGDLSNNSQNKVIYNYNEIVTLYDIERVGYSFYGWYTTYTFEGEAIEEIPLGTSGNFYVYPKWQANDCTISFIENGGSNVLSITQAYETVLNEPQQPTRLGYEFTKWYSNSETKEIYIFDRMPANDITLYADWLAIEYIISYDIDDNTTNNNVSYYTIEDNDITILSAEKSGNIFEKWYLSGDETQSAFTTIVAGSTGDISLIPVFVPISYTITLSAGEGVLQGAETYAILYGQTEYTLPIATFDGGVFNGWRDMEGTRYTDEQGKSIRAWDKDIDTKLYALWANEYVVIDGIITGLGDTLFITNLYIPNTINGIQIIGIGDDAFKNKEGIKSMEVASGITTIGNNAFYGCTDLESLALPNTIVSIGTSAFDGCASLKNLILPNANFSLGNNAFLNCSSLTEINISSEYNNIGTNVLKGCSSLEKIAINTSITLAYLFGNESFENSYAIHIGDITHYVPNGLVEVIIKASGADIIENSFSGATSLKKVIITNIINIKEKAFYGCTGIEEIILPKNLTTIGSDAFACCNQAIYIYDNLNSLTTISQRAFQNNSNIVSFIAKNINSIGDDAFAGCSSLRELTFQSSKEIGMVFGESEYKNSYAVTQNSKTYYLPTSLETVSISDKSTTINDYAFQNCTEIKEVLHTNTITSIGKFAFEKAGLLNFVVGTNVLSIGDKAFALCNNLVELDIQSLSLSTENASIGQEILDDATALIFITINGNIALPKLFGTMQNTELYAVEIGTITYYIPYSLESFSMSSGSQQIADNAFKGIKTITSLSLTDLPITAIGTNAFYGCENFYSINIPEGTTSIADNAFYNCKSLVSINIPESLVSLGENLFYGCNSLYNISINEANEYYESENNVIYSKDGESLIYYPKLKTDSEYTIKNTVTHIYPGVFANNIYLSSITIPPTIQSIGEKAFENCIYVSFVFNGLNNLEYIGDSAFQNCNAQTTPYSIELSNVSYIGNKAFYNTSFINGITANQIDYIGEEAFANCSALASFSAQSIGNIASKAFENCTLLECFESVEIESMTELAFNNCMSMKTFTMGGDKPVSYYFGGICDIVTLKYAEGVTTLNTYLGDCSSIQSIYLSQSILAIDAVAFYDLYNLESIHLNENENFQLNNDVLYHTPTGALVYYMASKTNTEFVVPEKISSIGNYAFANNEHLKEITFPESIESVGNDIFYNTAITVVAINTENATNILSNCDEIIEIEYKGNITVGQLFGLVLLQNGYTATQAGINYQIPSTLKNVTINGHILTNNALEGLSTVTTVSLGTEITIIRDYTFKNCNTLIEINLENITTFGREAFYGCIMLEDFNLPTYIGDIGIGCFDETGWYNNQVNGMVYLSNYAYAFKGDIPNMYSLTIQDGTTNAIPEIFVNQNNLFSIQLPNSLTSFFNFSFMGCTNLEEVIFDSGSTIDALPKNIFKNCHNLKTISLPNSITVIGESAFESCFSLAEFAFPPYIVSLSTRAFADCNSLVNISLPSSLVSISSNIFIGCTNVVSATVPVAIEGILTGCINLETLKYNGAYETCRLFGNLYIANHTSISYNNDSYYVPNSLAKIELINTQTVIANCFRNMSMLEEVVLPDTIDTIGNNAFENCYSLLEMIIPPSVQNSGNNVFSGCLAMQTVFLSSHLPELLENTNIDTLYYSGNGAVAELFSKSSLENTYEAMLDSNRYYVPSSLKNIFARGITISDNAFYAMSEVSSITITSTIKEIGTKAFYGVQGNLYFQAINNIEYIGKGAFDNSMWYNNNIVGSQGVVRIGNNIYEFMGDMNQNYTLSIEEGIVSITEDAFAQYNNLVVANLPSSLMVMGNGVFADCVSLEAVNFAQGIDISILQEKLFSNCASLHSIILPNSINNIQDFAFENCKALDSFALPTNLLYLGSNVFENAVFISEITISDAITEFGANPFKGANIEKITLQKEYPNILSKSYVKHISIPGINTVHILFGSDIFDNSYIVSGIRETSTKYFIPETLKKVELYDTEIVERYALFKMKSVTTVVLSDGIHTINDFAFEKCDNLVSLNVPLSLHSIGMNAFSHCSSLNIEIFSNSPTLNRIASYAFEGCSTITSFTLGSAIVQLGESLFKDCNNLADMHLYMGGENILVGTNIKKLYIHNSNINIKSLYGNYTMSSLATIEVSEVTTIGDNYFANLEYVKEIIISNSVDNIGEGIYAGCSQLESIILPFIGTSYSEPQKLGYLFSDALFNDSIEIDQNGSIYFISSSLKSIKVTNETIVYENTFYNCDLLINVVYDKNITEVQNNAFYNCTSCNMDLELINTTIIGDYAFNNCINYAPEILVIGSYIESVGEYAFNNCTSIELVDIMNGAKVLKKGAFADCTNLRLNNTAGSGLDIISSSITEIGEYAFNNCISLENIYFGEEGSSPNLSSIGAYAFMNCKNIETINFRANSKLNEIRPFAFFDCFALEYANNISDNSVLTSIGNSVFMNTSLREIIMPNSLTTIGDNIFSGCSLLQEVVFGDNIHEISVSAFENCIGLTTLIMPSITSIRDNAFYKAVSLTSISLPTNISSYGQYSFAESGVTSFTIGASVSEIPRYAFYNCKNLGSVTINGDTLMQIYDYAFYGCESLGNITFPQQVGYIGAYAFWGCHNITSVSLGKNISYFGESSFANCLLLTEINIDEECGEYVSIDGVLYKYNNMSHEKESGDEDEYGNPKFVRFEVSYLIELICYPTGKTNTDFDIPSLLIPDSDMGLAKISPYAFYNNKYLTKVTMTNDVILIGEYCFAEASNLQKVTLSNEITNMPAYAFYNCNELTTVNMPSNLEYMEEYSFAECHKLNMVTLPDQVRHIEKYAFYNCKELTTINFPSQLNGIDEYCFAETGLTEVILNSGLHLIKRYAFYNCESLTNISLASSVLEIDEYAFANATSLTTVMFHNESKMTQISTAVFQNCIMLKNINTEVLSSCDTINDFSFDNCSSLESIELNDKVREIGKGVFNGCESLQTLTLGEDSLLSTIGEGVFKDCSSLTNIVLPIGVNNIPKSAFENCILLVDLNIHENVFKIEEYAFKGCINLKNECLQNSINVDKIGKEAFYGCVVLTQIILPEYLNYLGENAFGNCTRLMEIKFIKLETNIEGNPLAGCVNLVNIVVPPSALDYYKNCFETYGLKEKVKSF